MAAELQSYCKRILIFFLQQFIFHFASFKQDKIDRLLKYLHCSMLMRAELLMTTEISSRNDHKWKPTVKNYVQDLAK